MQLNRTLILTVALTIVSTLHAQDLFFDVKQVDDKRTTGQHFAECNVEVACIGTPVEKAVRLKVSLTGAADDTGRSLLDKEQAETDFKEKDTGKADEVKVELKLMNPSRAAKVIAIIEGEVTLFSPSLDPDAEIVVTNLPSHVGKPVAVEALQPHGIQVTYLTKETYEAVQGKEKARAEKELEKAAEEHPAEALAGGLGQLFEGMFSAFTQIGPNDLVLNVQDAKGRLVGYEIRDASGEEIRTNGSMTMNETRVLRYGSPLPADARLVLWVGTDLALKKHRLKLENVRLP